jgi:hypothetical protein
MEIFTYGSGEFVAGILEAAKTLTSGGVVLGLVKILLITGLLAALATVTIGRATTDFGAPGIVSSSPLVLMIRNAMMAAIAVYFLLNPFVVTDVIVEDKYDPSQSKVVTSVPTGIAFIGHATSVVGDKMGEVIEELITPVEAVRFRTGGGVAIGPKYLNNLFDIMPPGAPAEYGSTRNIPTRGVVESWFSKCIYAQFGQIQGEGPKAEGLTAFASTEFLLTEPKLSQPPFIDPNTPLAVQYYTYPAVNETTCNNATAQIIAAWYTPGVFDRWVARFSARQFGTKEDDPTVVPRVYDLVDRYFPNSTLGTQDKLVQLALLNSAYAAYVKFATEYSDAGSADIAKRQQGGAWLEIARVGTKSLFVMRQIAEASLYLFGAFLPVFLVTAGFGTLFQYVKFAFWLQLWIPIFVIFNAISDYNLFKIIESVSSCPISGPCTINLNFETVHKLRAETGQILGYIGLLSMSVPGIAWGLMKGAENVFGGAISAMGSSHQAGQAGARATTERTAATVGYSTGTMVNSTAQAGIGQETVSARVLSAGSPGVYGDTVAASMAKEMSVGTWQNQAVTQAGLQMGPSDVMGGTSANFMDSMGKGLGKTDAAAFSADAGFMAQGSTVADLSRMENRHASIISDDGVTKASFGGSGGMPVASFQKAALSYTGADGKTKTLLGAEGQVVGNKFAVKGLDMESRQMVNLQGRAQDIDLANSAIKGYEVVSGKGESGMDYRRTTSAGQALEEYKDLSGSKFYQGLSAMDKDKAVQITENRDAQTGRIANITAEQGSRSVSTDRDDRTKLTNIHSGSHLLREDTNMSVSKHGSDNWSGNRTIREDTDMSVSKHGTDSWAGFRNITENTNMKTGMFKDTDPETRKEAMYYGRWHTDPDTGKQVAADFTNLQTGRVSTVRTTTDDKGNKTQHFGVGTYQSGPGGVGMVSNFRELSTSEEENKGYASVKTKGQAGNTLLQVDRQGQDTTKLHRFTEDHSKQFRTSVGAALSYGGDLTQLNELQEGAIKGIGIVDKGAELVQGVAGFGKSAQYIHKTSDDLKGAFSLEKASAGATEKTVNASEAKPPMAR